MMKLRSLHTTKIFEFYAPDYSTELDLPFVDVGISAGFPSPADDFIELTIDLNKIAVPSLLQVIEEASLTHPKIKLVEFKTDMLQVERQYKSQNLLPTFRVNYNFLNKGYQFSNPMNQSLYTNNYKAGVQFGLPLFLRQARGDLKQANIKIAQQAEETKQVKLEIENKINFFSFL